MLLNQRKVKFRNITFINFPKRLSKPRVKYFTIVECIYSIY